jgi:hypothetical protein
MLTAKERNRSTPRSYSADMFPTSKVASGNEISSDSRQLEIVGIYIRASKKENQIKI